MGSGVYDSTGSGGGTTMTHTLQARGTNLARGSIQLGRMEPLKSAGGAFSRFLCFFFARGTSHVQCHMSFTGSNRTFGPPKSCSLRHRTRESIVSGFVEVNTSTSGSAPDGLSHRACSGPALVARNAIVKAILFRGSSIYARQLWSRGFRQLRVCQK